MLFNYLKNIYKFYVAPFLPRRCRKVFERTLRSIFKPVYKFKSQINNCRYIYAPDLYNRAAREADKAYRKLIDGEVSQAKDHFFIAVNHSGYEKKEMIFESFSGLSRIFDDYEEKNTNKSSNNYQTNTPDITVLLIEGMHNSGSGATYDYLSKFSQINLGEKRYGEFFFVNYCHGIHDLCLAEDFREFENKLVVFFGKHITGLTSPLSFSELCSYASDY